MSTKNPRTLAGIEQETSNSTVVFPKILSIFSLGTTKIILMPRGTPTYGTLQGHKIVTVGKAVQLLL